MEEKYFSDIVDIEEDLKEYGNLLCYIAPCGSGKSYFVKDKEKGLASKGKVLFLTSRKAKVDEDVNDKNNDFEEDFKSDFTAVTNMKLLYKIKSLMEYKYDTSKLDEFIDKYDYIVVDEVHALACDSEFQNNIITIISFLKYAAFVKNKPVIAMSATLVPVRLFLKEALSNGDKELKIIDMRDKCVKKIPGVVVNKNKEAAIELIKKLIDENKKFIYFANTYESLEEIYNTVLNFGVDKKHITVAMSQKNQNKFDNTYGNKKDNRKSREYLSEHSELRSEIKILFATSTYKEGIGIKNDDIDYVFCEAHYVPDIIQYMGRVRKPAKFFQIVSDSQPIFNNIDDMDYSFCGREDFQQSCKNHLSTLKYEKNNDEKFEFIKFLNKRFEYLAFDFLNNEFVVDTLKYTIQKDMEKSNDLWENDLDGFIKAHPLSTFLNVSRAKRDYKKEKAEEEIKRILGKPQFGKDRIKEIYNLFEIAYGIKAKQPKKFAEAVKPLFYKVEYCDTTKDEKHVRKMTVSLDRSDEFFEYLYSVLDEFQKIKNDFVQTEEEKPYDSEETDIVK